MERNILTFLVNTPLDVYNISQSDPRRCDMVSYRRLDRTTIARGDSLWTHTEVSHSR